MQVRCWRLLYGWLVESDGVDDVSGVLVEWTLQCVALDVDVCELLVVTVPAFVYA
jgi:hypothetical protein